MPTTTAAVATAPSQNENRSLALGLGIGVAVTHLVPRLHDGLDRHDLASLEVLEDRPVLVGRAVGILAILPALVTLSKKKTEKSGTITPRGVMYSESRTTKKKKPPAGYIYIYLYIYTIYIYIYIYYIYTIYIYYRS